MKSKWILAALSAAVLVPVARAQEPATSSAPARATANVAGKAPVSDQLFATAAAASGMAEVSISRLGVQKATDPELKKFSQRMIDEHTKVNQELMTLAARKGVTVPNALDARAAFCGQSLAGLSGEEFDKCYAKAQLVAHMEAAATFESEAQRGTDPEMKAFAARTLPHIKDHLRTVKPLAQKFMKDEEKAGSDEHHDQAK